MEVDALRHIIPATGSTELFTPIRSAIRRVGGKFSNQRETHLGGLNEAKCARFAVPSPGRWIDSLEEVEDIRPTSSKSIYLRRDLEQSNRVLWSAECRRKTFSAIPWWKPVNALIGTLLSG